MSASWLNRRPNISIAPSDQPLARGTRAVEYPSYLRTIPVQAPSPPASSLTNGSSARSHIAAHVTPRSRSFEVRADEVRLCIHFAEAVLAAEEMAPAFGVAHREVVRGEAEPLDEGERELVRAGNAHRTRFGLQAVRERLAHREHAPADAVLRFEDDRLVAGAQELRRGRQARPCRRRRR